MLKNALLLAVTAFVLFWGFNFLFVSWQINRHEGQQIEMIDYSRALNNVQLHKQQVNEFYSHHGQLPQSNRELGIAAPESFRTASVVRRTIGPNGLIDIEFDESLGKDARLTFIPTPNPTGVGATLQWRCYISGLEKTTPTQMALGSDCERLPEEMTIASIVDMNKPVATVDNLITAIYSRREKVVRSLISQGIDVNGTNSKGTTPLIAALEKGNARIVKLLIKSGSNAKQRLARNNQTLLMHFVEERRNGISSIIHTLINAGVKIEARDNQGKTALMYAAINKNHSAVRTLMDAGADLKAKDIRGQKAVDYAALNGRKSSVYRTLYNAEHKPVELFIKLPENGI